MEAPVTYLFDPFCGWCYGAAPIVAGIRAALGDANIRALPVGLFAGPGARPMNAQFKAYAWSNDQRIAAMTGQPFTQAYLDGALSDFATPLDSGPPTRAFGVAEAMRPGGGLDMLARMQRARFVEGRGLYAADSLAELAADIGLDRAAFAQTFAAPDAASRTDALIGEGQTLLDELGLRGVPALAISHGDHLHAVSGGPLLDPKAGLAERLAEQYAGAGAGHDH